MKSNDGTKIPNSNFVKGATNAGELDRNTSYDNSTYFSHSNGIDNMDSHTNENLDDPGFTSGDGHIYKFGTPYGEKAMFNELPPGMDITHQRLAIFNDMPLKTVTAFGYPGDGAFPVRDVEE